MLTAAICWSLLSGGCGIKGPPVPPERFRPAAVSDLSFELIDDRVQLSWTIPPSGERQAARIKACTVYRAKRALAGSDCIDCSAAFTKAAVVNAPEEPSGENVPLRLGYSEVLAPGFDYAYRVACQTASGVLGNQSNAVSFQSPQPTTQQQ